MSKKKANFFSKGVSGEPTNDVYVQMEFEQNLNDEKGNVTPTATSPIYVLDNFGYSLRFNGVSSIVNLGQSLTAGKNNFTIAFIAKTPSNLFFNPFFGSWVTGGFTFELLVRQGRLCVYNSISGSNTSYFQNYTTYNIWQSIICSYDNSSVEVYLNGVKHTSGYNVSGLVPATLQPDYLGRHSTNSYANHQIDKFRFYDRALTESEVAALSNELLEI